MRRTFVMLFGFALPGMAAGWLLAGGVLRLGGELELTGAVFAAFALAGALAGRWAIRSRSMLGAGLLVLTLFPVFSTRLLLPAVSFAFGIFAVRPIKPDGRTYFQCGALAATVAGFLAGGPVLTHPIPLRIALALLVPAAAALAAADRRKKRLALTAMLLIGAGIVCLPWRTVPHRSAGHTCDEQMLARHLPDLRLLTLEPEAPTLRALVTVDFPSAAADSLRHLYWVKQADTLHLSGSPHPVARGRVFVRVGDLDREIRRTPEKRYDLVYILDAPAAPAPAQERFIRHAAAQWLAPGGVLAVPAGFAAPIPGFHTCLLPGSLGRVRMWAADGTELADTFDKLERRLQKRAGEHNEILPGGLLETLYGLRPSEPENASPAQLPGGRLEKLLRAGAERPLSGVFAGLLSAGLVLAGFWLGRYPRYGDHFAIYARGAACMLCFLPILREADHYRLLVDMPIPALFGLILLALPHRAAKPGVSAFAAMVLVAIPALLAGSEPPQLSADFSRLIPAAVMTALLFFAPAFRLGTGHNGSESARYLHFCGLLTGLALAVMMPYWYAIAVALLLLWL